MADQNETSSTDDIKAADDIMAAIHNILKDGNNMLPDMDYEPENEPEPVDDAPAEDVPVAEPEETPDDVVKLTPDMIVGGQADDDDIGKIRAVMASTPEEREDDDFKPEPVISDEPDTEDDELAERMRRIESDDVLMSEPSVDAAASSLKSLREFADDKKAEIGNGALTIETIVRESVKPYLKEWLDANLPAIVERIVKKEVAHIMDRLDLK